MPSFSENFAPMPMGSITVHCSDFYNFCVSVTNFMLIKLGKYQKICHCLQSNLVDSTYLDIVINHVPRNTASTFLGQLDQHVHRSAVVL